MPGFYLNTAGKQSRYALYNKLCNTRENMSIWEQDKLLLFIAFVIPGFVSLKAYELFFPSQRTESAKQIVEAVTYSCINYALLFWLIAFVERSSIKASSSFLYFLFYVFVLFVAPIIWVWLWKKIRTSESFQNNAPHPIQKPWDYVFGKRIPYWVIVTLKDGTKIAGSYDSNSFSSNAPAEEQLYLEEAWVLNEDGGFERPRESTEGIIILSSEMVSIELFSKS